MRTKLSDLYSIAIFGSLARMDCDNLSDKDLLIISDDDKLQKSLQIHFYSSGWSCTVYTWPRLHWAIANNALFVQHLKQEAKIIYDPSGTLVDLLKHFTARVSYKPEIESSKRLLGILEHIPNNVIGRLWALDVLMVGMRSLAVGILANEGIYRFSLKEILDGLIRLDLINSSDASLLSGLRYYKKSYRHRNFSFIPKLTTVFNLIDLVSRKFSLGLHVRCVNGEQLVENCLKIANGIGKGDWYINSRRLEAGILMLKPRHNRSEVYSRINRLLHSIQLSKEYIWQFGSGIESTQKNFKNLLSYCDIN